MFVDNCLVLTIVLSVLPRFISSDYLFGIFMLLLHDLISSLREEVWSHKLV